MFVQHKKQESVVGILNDLIRINNDRISAYRQAINKAKNTDFELAEILEDIVLESELNKQQLIEQLNGSAAQMSSIPGDIYNAWTELKINFTKNLSKSLIACCEHNEDIVQHIYNTLTYYVDLSPKLRTLISEQQDVAKRTHYLIKTCKDSCHVFY